jgi:hypothetical protein
VTCPSTGNSLAKTERLRDSLGWCFIPLRERQTPAILKALFYWCDMFTYKFPATYGFEVYFNADMKICIKQDANYPDDSDIIVLSDEEANKLIEQLAYMIQLRDTSGDD